MITRSLLPWTQLTRTGIPQFLVSRSPLVLNGVTLPIGDHLAHIEHTLNRTRLRQLYEQRRITPAIPPPNTRQSLREQRDRVAGRRTTVEQPAATAPTRIADSAPDLDLISLTPPVPVSEEPMSRSNSNSKSSGGYTPLRRTSARST